MIATWSKCRQVLHMHHPIPHNYYNKNLLRQYSARINQLCCRYSCCLSTKYGTTTTISRRSSMATRTQTMLQQHKSMSAYQHYQMRLMFTLSLQSLYDTSNHSVCFHVRRRYLSPSSDNNSDKETEQRLEIFHDLYVVARDCMDDLFHLLEQEDSESIDEMIEQNIHFTKDAIQTAMKELHSIVQLHNHQPIYQKQLLRTHGIKIQKLHGELTILLRNIDYKDDDDTKKDDDVTNDKDIDNDDDDDDDDIDFDNFMKQNTRFPKRR